MDRYNALVSRHLIAAVIEVGQAKGGTRLDTDAMAAWLASLPASERSNLRGALTGLKLCLELADRAADEALGTGKGNEAIAGRFGRVIKCPLCDGYTSPEKQQCECCGRDIAPF